jgi:tetratricopeptide (TPR) repeat protein
MASVFLSYDREDADRVRHFARSLEKAGHEVWWDLHVRGGAQFSKVIEEELKAADVVVVLWSMHSVESAWVKDEAAAGRDSGKLVPVTIDGTQPPLGFRQFQTIDFSKRRAAALEELLLAIGGATTGASLSSSAEARTAKRRRSRNLEIIAVAALASAFAAVWVVGSKPFGSTEGEGGIISAAVVPADSSAQSSLLSNDLVAKLGATSTQKGSSFQLLQASDRSKAAFMFQVGGSNEQGQSRGDLLLLDRGSSAVLWSGQFERPVTQIGDLQQEMGYTASQLVACASEAYRFRQLVSKLDLIKSFLAGCAAAAGPQPEEPETQVQTFRRIVAVAPKFTGAWAQLLLAESQIAGQSASRRSQLQADIKQARKLDANLPEAYVSELSLLSDDAYASALSLLDQGLRKNPDSSLLLDARSGQLLEVGRLREAVEDAKRAAELDPASPILRTNYIYALANSGRIAAAVDELKVAERFWPGSSGIARVKYILNSRYGDPKVALAYVDSSAYEGDPQHARVYLQARIDPTPANINQALRDARDVYAKKPQAQTLVPLIQALAMFGRQKELLNLVMATQRSQFTSTEDVLFRPTMRILWLDPQSLVFAKRLGLLQYWSSSGRWPDFCSQPNFPYDCKKEAAKLGA